MTDDLLALQNFDGVARLFPLPNLVLFPYVIQALHIFEPRYRRLTADALEKDRLIAMVLLRPGWEKNYEGRPPLHPFACLGRITAHKRLQNGRYNLQLRGLIRARIVKEMRSAKLPYRTARVELVPEVNVEDAQQEKLLRRHMGRAASAWFPTEEPGATVFRKLVRSNLPLGMICDVLAFALPLDVQLKQELLESADVAARIGSLVGYLKAHPVPQAQTNKSRFPPEFSDN
jgi:Lon protease-like protein